MAERDETRPVLNTEEVYPAEFGNNPNHNIPINLQWRDRWLRENSPNFVGPPDLRNPLWYNSKTNTWTTESERGLIIKDAEDWYDRENRKRAGQSLND